MYKLLFAAYIAEDDRILKLTEINAAWLRYRSPLYNIWLGVNDLSKVSEYFRKSFRSLNVSLFEYESIEGENSWLSSMHARYPCGSSFIDFNDDSFCMLEQDVFMLNPIPAYMFKLDRPAFPRCFHQGYIGDFMIFISDSKRARSSFKIINACVRERLQHPDFLNYIISPRIVEDPNRVVSTEELLETVDSCTNNLMSFYNFEGWSMPHVLGSDVDASHILATWQAVHMSRWSLRITKPNVVMRLMDHIYAGVTEVLPVTRSVFDDNLLSRDAKVYFHDKSSS